MKKFVLLLLVPLMVWTETAWAQSRKITGRVLDENGEGLPGAGISIKGSQLGTVTNVDGNFSLDVPNEYNTLSIQSVGYMTQEVSITEDVLTVRMTPSITTLNETVVTALGISREKKQLGYTVNKVEGDALERSGEHNIIEALAAKAPGVNVISSSGLPGASSKIILRGYSNFTGENQPIIVVDGIPVDNSTSQPLPGDYPFNINLTGVNESNRLLDINPDDIESVSILKGPAAAALYGERGGNGAIMITTKKGTYGKKRGLGIKYSSSVEVASVNKLPKLQNQYAQGNNGVYSTYNAGPDGLVGTADDVLGTPNSWGPRIDTTKLQAYDNDKAFFKNAVTLNNDISIAGGNENSIFRLGISNLHSNGIVPNSKLDRTTVKLSAETKLANWITVGGSGSYAHTEGQRVQNGSNVAGIMLTLLRTPASFDITNYYDATRHQQNPYYFIYDNPLFTAYHNPYTDYTNRVTGNVYTNIDFAKNFELTWKLGSDNYSTNATQIYDLTSLGNDAQDGTGQINRSNNSYTQYYSDLILKYTNKISHSFDISAFAGFNYWYEENRFDFSRGRNIQIPDVYNLGNTTELYASNINQFQKTDAVFAEATLGFKQQLYLTLTGRNEWSSTFGKSGSSFFYPKADMSWVFSNDLPKNDYLNFGKLRLAYSTAATSPTVYSDRNYYVQPFITDGYTNGNGFPYLGQTGYSVSNVNYPGNLKPQYVTAIEVGLETRMINNRVTFEITYYNQTSRDILLLRPVSPSSGYQYEYVNAGKMRNNGIELILGGDILKSNNFQWNITANWSKNKSKVLELVQGVDQLSVESGFSDIGSYAIVGEPYGVFYGTAWQRDASGKILVDENGKALVGATAKKIGDPNPDWLMNINNSFSWKGLTFSFLWDIRQGGDIWDGTYARLTRLGRTDITADRDRTFVIDGVYAPGTTKAGQANTTTVSATYYYQTFMGDAGNYAAENAIQDGSWVRLREVGLSYRFRFGRMLKNPVVQYLDLGITGRNLLLFTKYKGVDPETSLTGAGSNIIGYDYFNNPGTKSVIFNLKLGL